MAIATTNTRLPKLTRCPVCGGLECLCRPRFFAGQLLTEDDLNRLEHYIVAKNKLHNRYLHGAGVVCGLEVSCHQCKGFVTVKSGYALSPCGDDIVLCDDQAVNVCELIQHCRQQQFDCESAFPPAQPICGEEDDEWILYVCYDERPTRGITPLRGSSSSACCSQCSCGGSSSCGCGGSSMYTTSAMSSCGCGGGASIKSQQLAYRQVPTKTLPQCEPTLTCEGFRFELRKAPDEGKRDFGPFINKITECGNEAVKLAGAIQALTPSSTPSQIQAVKTALINFANQHSIVICGLIQAIQNIPTSPIDVVKNRLTEVLIELIFQCVCSALLPPCAPPAEDNCVPLATITLNCRQGCNVVRICSVEHRQQLVTMPALKYWFEGLLKAFFGRALKNLCCQERDFEIGAGPGIGTVGRPVALNNLVNQMMQQGGTMNSQAVFKHLGALFKEMTAFTRQ